MTHPSDADHDVARMQIGVHKVVGQQHLEVGVDPKGHNLGVEGAGLPYVLCYALSCKKIKVEMTLEMTLVMTELHVRNSYDESRYT